MMVSLRMILAYRRELTPSLILRLTGSHQAKKPRFLDQQFNLSAAHQYLMWFRHR